MNIERKILVPTFVIRLKLDDPIESKIVGDVMLAMANATLEFMKQFGEVVIRKPPELYVEDDAEEGVTFCKVRFRAGLDPSKPSGVRHIDGVAFIREATAVAEYG